MNRNIIIILGLILVTSAVFLTYNPENDSGISYTGDFDMVPADSEGNFNNFLKLASDSGYYYGSSNIAVKEDITYATANEDSLRDSGYSDARYSETNVQVVGVDEADIVKTNGKYIFYTTQSPAWVNYYGGQSTYVIDALPPETAQVIGNITDGGNLYLEGDNLVVITYDGIKNYNISNPKTPELVWAKDLNGSYVDSRLIDGELYIIIQEYGITGPIIWNNVKIGYDDIYLPVIPEIIRQNFETTYIISSINVESGEIENTAALVGSYSNTIYVSEENIYFAYELDYDEDKLMMKFVAENADKYFPKEVTDKLDRVFSNTDFGDSAKYVQMTEILEDYIKTLSSEEINNLENEIENDYEIYLKEHWEELEGTGIAKISLDDFKVTSGKVPGTILNSFSMDEYEGNLRIATTIGNDWRFRDIQTNNIYVFDENMDVIGKVTGLEEGERIYSARFMGDKAYVVTYKETDPLLVIDLDDPKNPELLGELKIPGYSTYLHPIGNNKLIGIGKDDSNMVKISLFDATDLENPKELSKYSLNEYWSSALYEHHAFLWDAEKEILVLPAGSHAYAFEVKESGIKMVKDDVFKDYSVLRSLYIGDYLYTFSNYEIHVIDENTWKTVKTINLPKYEYPYLEPYIEPVEDFTDVEIETINEKVAIGENISIKLDENPTTGYTWNYSISDDDKIELLSDEYIEDETDDGIVGAGGVHEWTFNATESGEVELTFDYYRSWEGVEGSINTIIYKITVE
ncbi:beta-propeller domain-containing protein [Methanococcus maripaludis]|uniref:Inhibitor of cysteine peptidase n=1 Tax=Methanococcus maripaludis TaxID=39152 RepID=A0A7J9PLT4_METMI|nr:beta-propeller domain-containing protein [Methanococcus maripaludis]MBA2864175.1 inhibitor of cysteine peptidase [Methanococcus maripaludis]